MYVIIINDEHLATRTVYCNNCGNDEAIYTDVMSSPSIKLWCYSH